MRNVKRYLLSACLITVVIFIGTYIILAAFIAQQAEKDTRVKSQAILVLGARSYIDGKYNPCLLARVDHAVELYKSGYAPKIVLSGGVDREDGSDEADIMKKIVTEQGIPPRAILEERFATSTYENFKLSDEILNKNNLKSIIVVTEPFHAARASLVAKKLGFIFTVSPAKNSPCWVHNKYFSKYFLKEPFAIMLYKLQNKL